MLTPGSAVYCRQDCSRATAPLPSQNNSPSLYRCATPLTLDLELNFDPQSQATPTEVFKCMYAILLHILLLLRKATAETGLGAKIPL